MAYAKLVELPTAAGAAHFAPDRVVFVFPAGDEADLVMENNDRFRVSLKAEDAAHRLWPFTNAASNGGFFNEAFVVAVVPTETGCKIVFSQGGSLDTEAPVEVIAGSFEGINEHRRNLGAQS